MKVTILSAAAVAVATLVFSLLFPLQAQQPTKPASVTTPNGFIVEEVRVGSSCVVIASSTGPGARTMSAVPCSR